MVDWLSSGTWHFSDHERQRMESAIEFVKGERILDVGCRDGTFGIELAMRNPKMRVEGFDSDASAIQWANDHASANATFYVDDLLAPKLPWGGQYDSVVCMETLEHLAPARVDEAHNRLLSFLRPGGRLIVSLPANSHISDPDHKQTFYREILHGQEGIVWSETCPHLWMMYKVDVKSQSSKDGPARSAESGATG